MRLKQKLNGALNFIGGFIYMNWFLIPVGICLYGTIADYRSTQFILEINMLLWLLTGGIVHQKLSEKDK